MEMFCNTSSAAAVGDVCHLNFYSMASAAVAILCGGVAAVLAQLSFEETRYNLLALHNLRSTLVILSLFVNVCEIAESCISIYPVAEYMTSSFGLISVCLSLVSSIILTIFVRIIEVRDKPGLLYVAMLSQGIQSITKIYKLKYMSEIMDIMSLQPFLLLCSSILLAALVTTDGFTIYRENTSSKQHISSMISNENLGYKTPHSPFLSKITFWWIMPLLWKGFLEPLELENLGNLHEKDTSRYQYDQFLIIYQSCKKKQISLWKCYVKNCWKLFLTGGVFKLFGDITGLVGPLCISNIVEYIAKNKSESLQEINNDDIYFPTWIDFISNGWIVCILVLISSLAQGTFSQASTHIVNMEGIKLKNAIQGLVYRKTLLLSSSCFYNNNNNNVNMDASNKAKDSSNNNIKIDKNSKSKTDANVEGDDDRESGVDQQQFEKGNEREAKYKQQHGSNNAADAGTITNLMSDDAFNVMSFVWIAHYVWAIPLKIIIVMYFLYQKLGISTIIGSLVCIITMTPLQFLIGKMMSNNSKKASECTDERLKRINEVLLGIKLIKLNAWEKVFKDKILNARRKELRHLDLDSFYWTLMTLLTHVSSVLVTFVTIAVFVGIENNQIGFTAGRVFSTLALFNQLTVPLFIFPITIPIIIAAVNSTKRLEQFLSQSEVEKEFEGIQNMARILCKSDASLDVFEIEDNDNDSEKCDSDKTNDYDESSLKSGNLDFMLINDNHRHRSDSYKINEDFAYETPEKDCENEIENIIFNNNKCKTNLRIKLKKNSQLSMSARLEKNRLRQKSIVNINETKSYVSDDVVVSIQDAVFSWNKHDFENTLHIDKLCVPKGKLTVVVGKSGAGKSSLLAALLNEIHHVSGQIVRNKYSTIAYVPQQPWLLNANIRDNILFGECFRPKRYDRVLEACALKPDIELMPSGDMCEIGERGIKISGGQRQRIALARALYSSANVVILDDPLSSLDNEVGKYVFENGLKKMLIRHRRTTILVTQKLQLVYSADNIIAMENNKIRATGTLSEIENNHPQIIVEWNSIIATEQSKETEISPGRTARERWKLFKNITRLGLQRTNVVEEDSLSSTQSLYIPMKRISSLFGSRFLTHDLPLPIDECQDENVELRRRFSKRHHYDNTSVNIDGNDSRNVFRTNSLQVSKGVKRLPVVRHISSPMTLNSSPNKNVTRRSDNSDTSTNMNKVGFRQFLRRMSSRRRKSSNPTDFSMNYRDKMKINKTHSTKSVNKGSHKPVKRLISNVSKYSEEMEDDVCSDYNEEVSNRLLYDEERKYGKIPTRMYLLYLRSSGLWIVCTFFLSAFVLQGLKVYTDVWLQDWTEINKDKDDRVDVDYNFKIYGILSGVCILLSAIATPAGQIAGSNARRRLHNDLLNSVLKNSLHYFQTVPLGRIMNRFSVDISVIDKKITATSQRLLQFILLCLCAVLINTVVTPYFILLTIPICGVYYVVQKFYRCSSRELQRIESITNSPIIAHFSETIQGVTTIRAYNQESRFMEMLFKRMEANNVAFIILNSSNRWLGIALDYLGAFIVFLSILTALITSYVNPDTTTPSLIGLAINYTLLVPIYLNWVVKLLADMEMYVGAVERLQYYVESEHVENTFPYKPVPISWPQKGDIVFENVTLRYENQKENVISDLNLTIPTGQRIGICGRTGSGKSSLAMSLFGVLEIVTGRILIDDVDISTIHSDELRSRLSIIPQDNMLFTGTIRENLDPRGHFSDLELWNCVEVAQLKDVITAQPYGLDTQIDETSTNMSRGQKQLFCLARAVLRGSACLVLDEATSSLDLETEKALLEAANKAFKGRTVITIAHRLYSLFDYDRIIVLDNGIIIEDGSPKELKYNQSSKFYAMLKASDHK